MLDDRGEDDLEQLPIDHGFSLSWWTLKWIALAFVGLAHVILTILLSHKSTGETLGMAIGFALWASLIGGVVWLIRGRKPSTFSGPFFWVAMVLGVLGILNNLLHL